MPSGTCHGYKLMGYDLFESRIVRSRAGWKIDGLEILLIKNQKKNKHAKLPHFKRILYFYSFIFKTLTNSFIYIHIHIIEKQVKKSLE